MKRRNLHDILITVLQVLIFQIGVSCVHSHEIDESDLTFNERRIYFDEDDEMKYLGDKNETLRYGKDLVLEYRRKDNSSISGKTETFVIEGVPQFFADISDEHVRQEVDYYLANGRWKERVIVEKILFQLRFGMSSFPDYYYFGDDPDNLRYKTKLERLLAKEMFQRDDDERHCTWTQVFCVGVHDDDVETRVTKLVLGMNRLEGTLPSEIQFLSKLETINLEVNQLHGTLPDELGSLTDLNTLILWKNSFSGSLPTSIFKNMPQLDSLWLSDNAFTGTLPEVLPRVAPNLTVIDLSENSLTGSIPASYGTNFHNLIDFYIGGNSFNGSLPEDTSGFGSLETFRAERNQIEGTISSSWFSLPILQELILNENKLSGTLSSELLGLSTLQILDLRSNNMVGTLPTSYGPGSQSNAWFNLTNLSVLLLSENEFSGSIPDSFFIKNSTMMNLDLAKNNFKGSISEEIRNMKHLRRFHIEQNKFSGTLPSAMAYLSPDINLNLTGNFFEGTVPKTFCGSGAAKNSLLFRQFGCQAVLCPPGTFSPSGAATMLYGCRPCSPSDEDEDHDPPLNRILGRTSCPTTEFVYGDIDGDGELSEKEILRLLWVSTGGENWGGQFSTWSDLVTAPCDLRGVVCLHNIVTRISLEDATMCKDGKHKRSIGSACLGLPAELGLLTTTKALVIKNQQFLRTRIPSEIGRLTSLSVLELSSTPMLSSTLPSEIGNLSRLHVLNIAGNSISGTVPEELYSLTRLEKVMFSLNQLSGTISSEIGNLKELKELMWSRNQISGTIPNEIGNVRLLENWEMYGNKLTGTIPSALGNCSNLKRIDIFNNNLTGSLPRSLARLSALQILHVKSNSLTGTIHSEFGALPFLSWFDVSSNQIHGTIPEEFGSSQTLKDFRVGGGNMIYEPIPEKLCLNPRINGGLTRQYGCDAVACRIGTYSDPGHATHSEGCRPCSTYETTFYLGSSECLFFDEMDILAMFYHVVGEGASNPLQKMFWQDPEDYNWCTWSGIECNEEGEILSLSFPMFGMADHLF